MFVFCYLVFFFFKQKTAYEMRISDWSSDVCSSDLRFLPHHLADLLPLLQESEDVVAYGQVLADRGAGRNFLKPPRAIAHGETMDRYLMCDRGFIQTSSMALSRTLAGKVRYREDVRFGDDTDFALRLSLAGARFLMTERPGTIWADRDADDRLDRQSTRLTSRH